MAWSESKLLETAKNVVDARLLARPRTTFPGADLPSDLRTAYAVQSRAIKIWPDQLVGFKVGGVPDKFKAQYPADWQVGPIFQKGVFHADGNAELDFPVFEDGFAAYEPELILQISSSAIGKYDKWSPKAAKGAIQRAYIGAEIASSPNSNVNALGPGSIISDFGSNGGIVIGQEVQITDIDKALSGVVETRIDGEFIGRKTPMPPPAGPLGAVCFLLEHLSDNADLYELPDTILIASGAITGVHESHVGTVGSLEYVGVQTLNIRLVGKPQLPLNGNA